MKALVYTGPEQMELTERAVPVPGPGEVRIRTAYTGICGSDLHGFLGRNGRRIPPVIMGHEVSGVISAVGDGDDRNLLPTEELLSGNAAAVPADQAAAAADTAGNRAGHPTIAGPLTVGTRVTVMPVTGCGSCPQCRAGLPNLCTSIQVMGVLHNDGCLAEEFCVPAANVCVLPENLSLRTAALCEPFAVCLRAVKHCGELAGKNVLVRGTGPIGYLTILALRAFHPAAIYVSGSDAQRLQTACRLGAKIYENRKDLDAAIECVGSEQAIRDCIAAVRPGGVVSVAGLDKPTAEIPIAELVCREIMLKGSYTYSMQDFREALAMMPAVQTELASLINREVDFGEAVQDTFAELSHNKGSVIKAVIRF